MSKTEESSIFMQALDQHWEKHVDEKTRVVVMRKFNNENYDSLRNDRISTSDMDEVEMW